jgi:hypothetical protein
MILGIRDGLTIDIHSYGMGKMSAKKRGDNSAGGSHIETNQGLHCRMKIPKKLEIFSNFSSGFSLF